jgi:hypothetical protein
VDTSPSGVINHEFDHSYHNINVIDFIQWIKIFRPAGFQEDKKPTKVFRKISGTASSSAMLDSYGCEFVAEVFSGLATEKVFANDILNLCEYLNDDMM